MKSQLAMNGRCVAVALSDAKKTEIRNVPRHYYTSLFRHKIAVRTLK